MSWSLILDVLTLIGMGLVALVAIGGGVLILIGFARGLRG